jgi:hypothetical protein
MPVTGSLCSWISRYIFHTQLIDDSRLKLRTRYVICPRISCGAKEEAKKSWDRFLDEEVLRLAERIHGFLSLRCDSTRTDDSIVLMDRISGNETLLPKRIPILQEKNCGSKRTAFLPHLLQIGFRLIFTSVESL